MYAWLRDGQPLEVGTTGAPAPADFAANLVPSIRASTDDVLAALGDGETLIIDARPPEQYRGETKSGLVARAGRIPGAMNLPHTEVFDLASRRLLAAHDILSQLPSEALRSNAPIIVYCNTGHWSSIVWFALHEVAGLPDVRLYDGSMQAWTEDPERPIETGPR
jgi:thiosulfate/3-mercaptopyruvate sulfurtransferase